MSKQYEYSDKETTIETPVAGLIIYKNKVFGDARGSLMQLAPSIPLNPHFPLGIKDLASGVAIDGTKPRGAHYYKTAEKDIWNIYGTALWYFLDMRDESPTKHAAYACIVGFREEELDNKFSDLPIFFVERLQWLPHFHIPPGVYDLVWKLGKEPAVFTETKTTIHDESDYVRIAPDDIEEVREFTRKYRLA